MNEPRMRSVLLVAAAYHLVLGAFMLFAPGTFYDWIGEFPPENAHFIRDVSTFYVALGIALYVSVHQPSWRVPVLGFAVVQYALHTVVHLIDVNDAVSSGKGWFSFFALALLTAALVVLLGAAARGVREPKRKRADDEPEPVRDAAARPEPRGESRSDGP